MTRSPYLARLLELDSLEALQAEMLRLDVDRGGIPIMASKGVLRLILIEQIPTAAANIIKQEVLARGGDLVTPAAASGLEVPRVDVVLIGNLTTLRSTISKLYRQRVYDLPRIADAIQNLIVRTTPGYLPVAPKASRQGLVVEETLEDLMGGRIPLAPATHRAVGRPTLAPVADRPWRFGELTYVMGTVDGALDLEAAWRRVERLVADGADIVEFDCEAADVEQRRAAGLAAAQAQAEPGRAVGPAEAGRVGALIRRTRAEYPQVVMAVRTARARAAEEAVAAGAAVVCAGRGRAADPDLARVVAGAGIPFVLQHDQPVGPGEDLLSAVCRSFWQAMDWAAAKGVREEQIILDPGLGCGKSVEQDRLLIRRLRELTSFGRPLLLSPPGAGGVSAAAAGAAAAAAAVALAIAGGADIIRVQDVAGMRRAARVADEMLRAPAGSGQ